MNQFEHWVYDRLKDNLRLKEIVKRLYQRAFMLIPGPKIDGHLCELEVRPHAFYGFHDKNPWSRDRVYLLGHRFPGKGNESWLDGAAVDICIHQGDGWRETVPVTRTHAWNWQQGAQLQWLGNSHCIIFNDIRDGLCSAVVHDLVNHDATTLPYPVAAISPDGQHYVAICFETLTRAMPGYGYGFDALSAESPVPALSLVICDLETSAEQWIHFADLGSEIPLSDEGDGIDFFSHCLFSPNGRQLLFLRRQALPNRRLRSELFCVELDSGRLQKLPFRDMVSHFTWLGDESVLAYANTESAGDGYYRVDVRTGCVENLTHMLNNSDGHPHAEPEGGRVVFDTYPDRRRYQHLYVWEADNDEAKHVARVYAPLRFSGDARVDLHPRLDALGEYVCFDAAFNSVRSQVTARLT